MKIKWSTIFNALQGAFIGSMLALCNISLNDWKFYVILVGNASLTAIISIAVVSEKKENEE